MLNITKIENIEIKQLDTSLSSANKYQDKDQIKKGKNTIADLGEGKKALQTTFIIEDENIFTKVFKIISKKRYVMFTDKFYGKFKAFITSYNIKGSDSHIGYMLIELNLKIIEDIDLSINFKSRLKNFSNQLKDFKVREHVINFDNKIIENNINPLTLTQIKDLPLSQTYNKSYDYVQLDYNSKVNDFMQYCFNNYNFDSSIEFSKMKLIFESIDIFNQDISMVFELLDLNFKSIKPIKDYPYILQGDIKSINNIWSIENIINSNINLNTIAIINLYLYIFINKMIISDLDRLNLSRLTIALIDRILNTPILNLDSLNIDYYLIRNDIVNYYEANSYKELEIIHNPLNIDYFAYKEYKDLNMSENLKYINNLNIEIIAIGNKFKYI
jgi:hypothetical protein